MAIADDLALIRHTLLWQQRWCKGPGLLYDQAVRALAALDRLEQCLVPDLPEGWAYQELSELNGTWAACLVRWDGPHRWLTRHGATVRAAVESAVQAIREESL